MLKKMQDCAALTTRKQENEEKLGIMESCAPGLTNWNYIFCFFPL